MTPPPSAPPAPPASPAPVPAPSPAPASSSAPAPQTTAQAAETPPDALLRLAAGARVRAVVTSLPQQGQIEVQTQAGTVKLETPLPLSRGAVLMLQVIAREPVLRFNVLSVDGTPAQAFAQRAAQTPGAGAPAQAATQITLSGSGAPLSPGLTLTATLLTPGRFIAAPGLAAGAAGAAPGAGHIGGHVRAFNLFGGAGQSPGQSTGQGGASPAGAAVRGGGPAGAGGAGGVHGQPKFAAAGSALRVTIASVTAPAPGSAPPAQPPFSGGVPFSAGLTLTGAVTGQTRAGHAIVQTQAGAVTLPASPPPMAGSQVRFTVLSPPEPPLNSADVGAARALLRAPAWPSFTDAMQALERADPALARQLAAAVLPNPAQGGGFAAGILSFLGALKTGDIRAALGDAAMRAVERARPAAAARLDGDVRGLSRAADDPAVSGDWRAAAIPAMLGHEIQPIRILTRRRGGDDDEDAEDGPDDTGGRFVVDVTLSRMGRVQLDGTTSDGGAHLDLIVRTERRLPGSMQSDIRELFTGAGALTGLWGGLTFQSGPGAFVEFSDDDGAPGAHLGVEA
ncbi:MAG: hypothetical protein ACYYKD_06810 [Rhodospirillales bacterium]